MQKTPVLLLSNDSVIHEQWQKINTDFWIIDLAQTVEQALEWTKTHQGMILADAALVDVTTASWQQLFQQSDVLVGSVSPNDTQGQAMIMAGAKAYFHSYSSEKIMNTMLQHVHNDHIWIGQDLLSRLLSTVSSGLQQMTNDWQAELTPREIEIAQRVALGHTNQLIADDLNVSERTVRAHLTAIFEKLGVADRLMLTLAVHGINPDQSL